MHADEAHSTAAPGPAAPTSDGDAGGWRGFFGGTGLPLFMLTAVGVYEAFLLAVVFAPAGTSAWGGFAREFKQWCFDYDPRTGGMEWAAVWVMLIEPAFVALLAVALWRRGLDSLRTLAGWIRHWRSAAAGVVVAGAAMTALYAYGRPAAPELELPPFPGQRIRTQLPLPAGSFTDQKGGAVALDGLRGRVTLVTGVYALCSTACPEILRETKTLLDELPAAARARTQVVALSLNPEYDTTSLMDTISEAYGFSHPEFRFVNGEPAAMHAVLTQLGFAPVRNPATGLIDHANLFLLVDAEGRIAYRFTLDRRLRSWLHEAVVSLAEEIR